MRLGYFAMPMHPAGRGWTATLEEDRQAIMLADELGFHDAFMGEHLTDLYENVTNSMLFMATLIQSTKRILLGTGTTNLSHVHPSLVAANAAMFDHLSDGRFILGVSPGALPSDAEILGILDEDRNAMFAKSIDAILRIWSGTPPYNIGEPGDRWYVTTERTMNPELGLGAVRGPLQDPRPEIVGTVVAPFSKGVIAMGRRDFHPLSANFLLSQWLRSHWDNYVTGKQAAGAEPKPSDWRVARTIFVADDAATARAYGRDSAGSPYRFYYSQMLKKMALGGRLNLFKSDQNQPDSAVTLEGILDSLVICGTPEDVAEQIVALRDEAGPMGEIVYAGMDWVDPDLGRRSMQLMAEEVMPKVNAAIGETS
ncbi:MULTISPECIES: LLM class flavin-dependent oxidoreductase [Actinomadura]|uniref:Flavin-dependent oxidoreductase, luciferase family (Includes alkanesulfonate monooxygenase SsuD and methylene tetrahydromethanopterin reductase) n=1 Tax=Actinomadura madurae TaxID=1993 RepID=A0A1I5NF51_9ACTN|nr:LLM class flavin-dependent oxidoreductase [Actinomadura madurae]SFP20310.1 Flavin-dependent oxidoreductase, luciferase family (includes alkanesulfonate monooxygenase SsuD and methylene tetrahydromethanopterin reductase) [Actinomadura madurae]SPT50181.1 Limonene 1,2-monooxygenase [Actinomadura madurae]